MGIELHVFGRGDQAASALAGVLRDHVVEEGERFRLVSREVRRAVRPAFTVDGPLRVEREDVPAEVLARIVGPDVLFQVTVQDDSGSTATLARRTCTALAKAVDGACYDPQADSVVWPGSPRRRAAVVPQGGDRVDALDLEWTTLRAPTPGTVAGLLDLLLATLPEAAPVRFGPFEPLQHRLDTDGPDAFVRAVMQDDHISWRARRPFVWGYVGRLSRRDAPTGHRPLHRVGLNVLLPALDDPAWRDEVVHLFGAVAAHLGCFHAQAAVSRGHRGTGLAVGTGTVLPANLADVHGWRGLPDHPVWLTWFGHPYTALVAPHLGTAPLVRTAEHPDDARPLPVPPELLLSGYRTVFGTPEGTPAALVPPPLPAYDPPPAPSW
ncbi:hypothetical protein [Blastococcus sp. SYSU DS1024]